jgi:hypothetical protein
MHVQLSLALRVAGTPIEEAVTSVVIRQGFITVFRAWIDSSHQGRFSGLIDYKNH